jgi:hypothetical protein
MLTTAFNLPLNQSISQSTVSEIIGLSLTDFTACDICGSDGCENKTRGLLGVVL